MVGADIMRNLLCVTCVKGHIIEGKRHIERTQEEQEMSTKVKYGDSLESLEEECSCCICLEYFTDPVSLYCGHVGCRNCLEAVLQPNLGQSRSTPPTITCPICRSVHFFKGRKTLNSLPTCYKTIEKLHLLRSIGGVKQGDGEKVVQQHCPNCPFNFREGYRGILEYKCIACDKAFCFNCIVDHENKHSDHFVAGCKKYATREMIVCYDHGFCFRYYCRLCRKMICSECLFQEHKGHWIISAKDAKDLVEDDTMEYLRSMIHLDGGFRGVIDGALCLELQKVENKRKTMAEEFKRRKAKILSLVISALDEAEEVIFEATKARITDAITNKKRAINEKQDMLTSWNRSIVESKAKMNDIDFLAKMVHLKASMSKENILDDLRDKPDFNFKLDLTDMKITDEIISSLSTSLGGVSLSSSRGTEIVHGQIAQANIKKIKGQDGSQLKNQLCALGVVQRDTSMNQAKGGHQSPLGAGNFTNSSSASTSSQHNGAKPRQNGSNAGWASQNANGRSQASNYSPIPNSSQGMGYNYSNTGTGINVATKSNFSAFFVRNFQTDGVKWVG